MRRTMIRAPLPMRTCMPIELRDLRIGRAWSTFGLALGFALGLALPESVLAAPGVVLRGVETRATAEGAVVRIVFDRPLRYRRHAPARNGRLLQITLDQVAPDLRIRREVLSSAWPERFPIAEIALEGNPATGGAGVGANLRLEVRFVRRTEYRVKPGRDLRSLTIEILEKPGAEPRPVGVAQRARRTTAARPAAADLPVANPALRGRLGDARIALRDGETERAIALLTHIVTQPTSDVHPEARELLGLARERAGQLAHARAEYRAYLEAFPDASGEERVRQRLAALDTRAAPEREPLRMARVDERRAPELRGSASIRYRRSERDTDRVGSATVEDGLYTDLFVRSMWQGPTVTLRSEFAGGYLYDLRSGRDDRLRANTAFLEAEGSADARRVVALGRQPGNERGLGSRFDGLRVTVGLVDGLDGTLLLGFPAEPSIRTGLDSDRQLAGLSLDLHELGVEGLEVQLFGLHQRVGSQTDRSAVGSEFRFVGDRFFGLGLVDWDIHHRTLNAAVLTGNWRFSSETHIHFLGESRNLPYLTTSNALFGQLDDDVDELRRRFSWSEIEELAADRTVRSKLVSAGVTRDLSSQWQLAADLAYSHLSGTPASGGIDRFEGPGDQFSSSFQLVRSGLFREGDVVTFGLRGLAAEDVDVVTALAQARLPVRQNLWLTPLMEVAFRRPRDTEDAVVVRPGFRFDWRIARRFHLDAEGLFEWWNGERFPGEGDETAFTFGVGGRMDF